MPQTVAIEIPLSLKDQPLMTKGSDEGAADRGRALNDLVGDGRLMNNLVR